MRLRRFVFVSLTLIAVATWSGCDDEREAQPPSIRLQRTPDPQHATGLFVPRTLDEALTELSTMLPDSVINDIKSTPLDQLPKYHFSIGMWIRNNWELWSGGPLGVSLYELGLRHPDDMSGVIIESFWREQNGLPIELEAQVARYDAWWQQMATMDSLSSGGADSSGN